MESSLKQHLAELAPALPSLQSPRPPDEPSFYVSLKHPRKDETILASGSLEAKKERERKLTESVQ